jgi:carbonic anhydrase
VRATLEELERPSERQSRNLRSIVDRIQPAVAGLLATDLRHDRAALEREATRANVRVAVNSLRHGSNLLEHLIEHDGLRVVGAEYSLETGVVELFDGLPAGG